MARTVVLVARTPGVAATAQTLARASNWTIFDGDACSADLHANTGSLGRFVAENSDRPRTIAPLILQRFRQWIVDYPTTDMVAINVVSNRAELDALTDVFACVVDTWPRVCIIEIVADESAPALMHPQSFFHVVYAADAGEALKNLVPNPNKFGTYKGFARTPYRGMISIWSARAPTQFGVPVDAITAAEIVQTTLLLARSNRQYRQFCGTHPVSLQADNRDKLADHAGYVISRKIDGVRYFILVHSGRIYFMDRSCAVWMGAGHPKLAAWNSTLLDCEVSGEHDVTIIDAVAAKGVDKRMMSIRKRLDSVAQLLPLLKSMPKLQFSFQRYCTLNTPEALEMVDGAQANCDGFVFTPARSKYILGRCHDMLKWKPNHKNSVDLIFRCVCSL